MSKVRARGHAFLSLSALGVAALWPMDATAHAPVTQAMGMEAGGGLWSGFLHPLGGLDHVLAMAAVGLWSAQRGGKATWFVPAAFVSVMLMAALYGGAPASIMEIGILASVLALGVLMLFRVRPPVSVAMLIVGVFAVFHGQAHGVEASAGALLTWYASGFTLATVLLHAMGIGLGRLLEREGYAWLLRAAGGIVAATGALLAIA